MPELLTEDQIERRVERLTDRLDARFMSGQLTQAEYDAEIKAIGAWAEREYPYCRAANRILAARLADQ